MPRRTAHSHTVLPPSDLEQMLDLSRFLQNVSEPAALLGPDGQTVPLPMEAFRVLREVVEAMHLGKAITIAPVDQLLTTQEAADFLGMSRPTFVKILERGDIPFEKTSGGRHRKVRLQDIVEYQEKQRSQRASILDDLTAHAYADGLYDQLESHHLEVTRQVRSP